MLTKWDPYGWLQHQCRTILERNMTYVKSKNTDECLGGSGAPCESTRSLGTNMNKKSSRAVLLPVY